MQLKKMIPLRATESEKIQIEMKARQKGISVNKYLIQKGIENEVENIIINKTVLIDEAIKVIISAEYARNPFNADEFINKYDEMKHIIKSVYK